jgi:hypothetical protein
LAELQPVRFRSQSCLFSLILLSLIAAMPLTPNGKINRPGLPKPGTVRLSEAAMPRTF